MKITITSRYGEFESFRTHPHTGIDLNFPKNSEIHSVHSGTVETVTNFVDNIGKGVIVKNDNGETSIFGHLESVNVKEGQRISEGDLIGNSGNSGHVHGSNGYHLHYGEKINGEFVDPTQHADNLIAMSGNSSGNAVIDYFKGFKERGMVANEGHDYNFWGDTVFPYFATEGKEFMIDCFNYLTMHLPEIFGGITIIAGGLIMIGLKVPKIASIYGISLVVAAFWRMSA